MSSDSEDDERLKQFMEAADTSLLNNAMFQEKIEESANKINDELVVVKKDMPKSQRYLLDDDAAAGTDFNLPETMQKHMAKKLSDILNETYEFYNVPNESVAKTRKKLKTKSRVKLLKGDDDYINSYEDFEYETKGPQKKPEIKRRCIDKDEMPKGDICDFSSIVISGNDVLSGIEVKCWATKKERKGKVFHYKQGANGMLHAKEEVNEFTDVRRKNKWNESKIKDFRRK